MGKQAPLRAILTHNCRKHWKRNTIGFSPCFSECSAVLALWIVYLKRGGLYLRPQVQKKQFVLLCAAHVRLKTNSMLWLLLLILPLVWVTLRLTLLTPSDESLLRNFFTPHKSRILLCIGKAPCPYTGERTIHIRGTSDEIHSDLLALLLQLNAKTSAVGVMAKSAYKKPIQDALRSLDFAHFLVL